MTEQTKNTQDFDSLQQVYDHAKKVGKSVRQLLLAAGMDPSSATRWKLLGIKPAGRTLERLLAVKAPEPKK